MKLIQSLIFELMQTTFTIYYGGRAILQFKVSARNIDIYGDTEFELGEGYHKVIISKRLLGE